MSACILSIVNMHNANTIVKNLIPNISNKSQIPLISKGYKRSVLKIEHMTWTYDPKLDPKEILEVILTNIGVGASIFHMLFDHLMPHCLPKFAFASRFANYVLL